MTFTLKHAFSAAYAIILSLIPRLITPAQAAPTQHFSPPDGSWSLSLPQDWGVDTHYAFNGLGPGRTLYGVLFTPPTAEMKGTNLLLGTGLAVVSLAPATPCSADSFLASARVRITLDEAGQRWTTATGSTGGQAEITRTDIFARSAADRCLLVIYLTRWAPSGETASRSNSFDDAMLWRRFDTLRRQVRTHGQQTETDEISQPSVPQAAPGTPDAQSVPYGQGHDLLARVPR